MAHRRRSSRRAMRPAPARRTPAMLPRARASAVSPPTRRWRYRGGVVTRTLALLREVLADGVDRTMPRGPRKSGETGEVVSPVALAAARLVRLAAQRSPVSPDFRWPRG